LESAGALEHYNGSSWVDVALNQEISATDISNNRLRFTPAANSESNPTFGFKVHDGTDYSSSANTITVSVNAAPNVTDATVGSTVSAGATSSGDVHDGVADSDDADSVLVVTGVASGNESSNNSIITNNTGVGSAISGTYGSLNIASNGTYTYTASATNNIAYGATATDTFTFTTRDDESNSGSNAYDVGTITFTVASSISLVADTDAVAEDGTVIHSTNSAGTVISDDAADTNGLVVTNISHTNGNADTIESGSTYTDSSGEPGSVVGTYGTLKIGADGTYTYTADQTAADALDLNDVVTDVFTYTADGATATLTITVTGINDAPVATNDTGSVNEDATLSVSNGSGDIIDNNDTDADDSASLVVSAVRIGGVEGSGTAGTVGQALTGTYGQLTLNANGSYSYVANQDATDDLDASDQVTDVFNYTLSDGTATDTATITIAITGINDAPVADDETGAVNEDATLTVTDGTSDVLHGDTDADDSASLTVSAIRTGTEGGSGTAGSIGSGLTGTYGTLTLASDGTYTYVADQSAADDLDLNDTATDVFTYTVSDGTATDTGTITITVTGVNDAPVAVNDTDAVNEDATVTRTSGSSLLMDDDSDADDDDSFTVTQIAATGGENSSVAGSSTYNNNFTSVTGNYGTLKVGADGTYTYVADQSAADDLDLNDPATDSFTYTISDGTTTDTATLIFTVTGVNDVPTAADKTVTTNEDTPYVFSTSDFGYTDADDDDALVSIKITTLENAGALQYYNGSAWVDVTSNQVITATDIAANKLRLNPTANENGSPYTTFNFTVNDGDADSASANTITVNVTAVNDAPTAANNTVTTNEDTDHTFAASEFNFTDVDGDSLDHISIETLPSNGTLLLSGNAVSAGDQISITNIANLVFRPATNENGTGYDTFTFSVNDGTVDGASTYTMTVNVTAVNDAPVADDETGAVNEDATLTVTDGTSDVLHGDTDVDSGDTLTVSAIRTGTEGGSGTAGSIGSGLTGTYGTLTLAADGTYTYAADQSAADDLDASDTATDIFTYTLSDGTATDTGTITITVTGVNDAPVAVNDTDAVNEDATVTRTSGSSLLMDDDSDADDDDSFTVTQIAVTGGSNNAVTASSTYNSGSPETVTGTYGTLTVGADGTYTYVADRSAADDLDLNDTATDSFTYTISDGTTTDTATLIFTVTGVNDAPVAVNDTDAVNEDATVTRTSGSSLLMDDDSDADDDDSFTVTQIAVTGGSNSSVSSSTTYSNGTSITGTYGTLVVGANGSYTYVADQSAADDLDLKILQQIVSLIQYRMEQQQTLQH
jgi:VCBS repeat-containing protein